MKDWLKIRIKNIGIARETKINKNIPLQLNSAGDRRCLVFRSMTNNNKYIYKQSILQ